MAKILSLLVLVLMFVLLVPTALVLASQNAVPGDATYPVKRQMENVIVSVASLHPATLAYFRVDFSKRRLTESVALVDKGSDANDALAAESLNDLATQTKLAVEEIKKVEDIQRRKYLAEQAIIDFTSRKAKIELIKTALASRSPTRNVQVPPPTPLPQIVQATPKIVYIVINNQTVVVTATPAPTTRPTAVPTTVPVASTGGGSGTGAAATAADNANDANNHGIDDATAIANGQSAGPTQSLPPTATPKPPTPTKKPCPPGQLCKLSEELTPDGPLATIPPDPPTPTPAPVFNPTGGGCPEDTYAQCLGGPQNGVNATCYQNGTNQAVADACIPNCGACQ